MNWIEWFGYLASVLVAVSLTMSSIVKLRWLNLAGAALFSIYGFIIGSLPVGFLNLYIVFVNIYYLHGIFRHTDRFFLVEMKLTDPLFEYWLSYYHVDIKSCFPDLQLAQVEKPICQLMLRNSEPVGLMVGSQQQETFKLEMDYALPPYQDFKIGHYLYRQSKFFSDRKITKILAQSSSSRHQSYLLRMGFSPVTEAPGSFEYHTKEMGFE